MSGRVAFWHAHLPECDPVCVLDSLGGEWGVTFGVQRILLRDTAEDRERLLTVLTEQGWMWHGSVPNHGKIDAILAALRGSDGGGA